MAVSEQLSAVVSIIVVNWNREDLLKDCLYSLSRQSYGNSEIIVVDNGSSDGSVASVKKNFPQVKIVELPENLGFTGGNIAGFERASGDFIALVNNDVRTEPDWLERLIAPMFEDQWIGSCASKLIIEGSHLLDSAGDGLTTAGVGFNRGFQLGHERFSDPEFTFAPCGAAALYRRRMLNEIGFLDNDYFLYDEDVDLAFRAQLNGWKCRYVPGAIAYHKGNATSERLSETHIYYHTRNLEFVWIKNMPAPLMIRFLHHKLIQELSAFVYLCVRHRKFRPFVRAKKDALRMFAAMWQKRREIQRHRKVSNEYVKEILTPIFNREYVRRKMEQLLRG